MIQAGDIDKGGTKTQKTGRNLEMMQVSCQVRTYRPVFKGETKKEDKRQTYNCNWEENVKVMKKTNTNVISKARGGQGFRKKEWGQRFLPHQGLSSWEVKHIELGNEEVPDEICESPFSETRWGGSLIAWPWGMKEGWASGKSRWSNPVELGCEGGTKKEGKARDAVRCCGYFCLLFVCC